ncbi:MAG: hypothetical protein K0R24_1285, partial [Gammaproteobacteria bacterium]|nr:hypothetical protein [Gammaproteobacteria bacterium]
MGIFIKVLRWLSYSIAGVIILAAIAVSLSHLSTPFLNAHRVDFEKWASDFLHTPVTINQVHISWYHLGPMLTFQKIAILDKKTLKPSFKIHKLKINMSIIESLMKRKLLPENIILDGVSTTLYQKKSGQVHLEGLGDFSVQDNFTGTAVAANTVTTWILSRPYLQLRNINIQFMAEKRQKRFFTLTNLVLSNTGKRHDLNGQAILDQKTPTRATIHLEWTGEALDILNNASHVTLYLYLEALSLPQWLSHFTWHGLQVKQGVGSGKVWITWDNRQLQKVQTQFQCYEIQLQSFVSQKTLIISRASGNVNWQQKGDHQLFSGENISLDFPQHLWPTTHFSMTLQPKTKGYHLQVGYLDLADSSALALASGLLTEPMKKELMALALKGEVRALDIQSEDITKPEYNTYSAEFSDLSFNAWQKLPSIKNLSGNISLDEKQGKLRLDSQKTKIEYLPFFAKPILLENISGDVEWQKKMNGAWWIEAKKLQIKNENIDISTEMTMLLPEDASPLLNLTGHFSFLDAGTIENYLPLKLLEPPFAKWLHHRFHGGKIDSAKVIVQGKLSDFPFEKGNGKFLIDANVKDLDFEYAPEWPAIHHLSGRLIFSGASMMADATSAQIFDVPLTKMYASIPYIGPAHPQILHLNTLIDTDIAQGLRFIQNSPLRRTIGKNLEGMQLTGPMQLKLACHVPVRVPEQTQVQGNLQVSAASLQLPDWRLGLDHLAGTLHFTEKSIQMTNTKGRLFNEPINFDINTEYKPHSPPVMKAILKGRMTVPALQAWLNIPLAKYLKGAADYTAELRIMSAQYAQPTQLSIHSNLVGMSVKLPVAYENYAKKESQSRDFELTANLNQDQPLQANLTYGNLATAALTYEKLDQDWQLKMLDIQANQIALLGQKLASAHLEIIPNELNWKIAITSPDIIGQIWLPKDNAQEAIHAEFKRLYLTPSDNSPSWDVKKIPEFSLIGDDVRYRDKSLGRVILNIIPNASGIEIKRFNIHSTLFNLNAEGSWLLLNDQSQTHFRGTLKTQNVSQFLQAWELSLANLVAETGSAEFNLSWLDAPYHPTLSNMEGHILLVVGKGRVINLENSTNAKIGFGRMLNILNLQTLPRRLSLDFTDLFEKG